MKAPKIVALGAPLAPAGLRAFVSHVGDEAADKMLVDLVGEAMTTKLAKKRGDGRGGWHKPKPEIDDDLRASLREHVDKGDMVDVVNLAAMLHVRSEIYGRGAAAKPAPAAKAKAVRKTAKKKPAAKKPARAFKRSTPTRPAAPRKAAPAKAATGNKLDELVQQATPLFKANPNLDREGLIKKIGRRYERITTFAALRAKALGEKAPAPTKAAPAAPKANAPKKTEKKAASATTAAKSTKPAKEAKGPWAVKAKGKQIGATILDKKVGDPITLSSGFFVVVSVDAEKREIQVETKAEAAARAAAVETPQPAATDKQADAEPAAQSTSNTEPSA